MGIGIHTFSGEPTPHSLFKASNTLGCFNRVSLAFTILGLLDLIYIYADLAEKMETRKWENIIQTEPGTFHVTKMKDTNTRQKDKHEGKRRYHENVSFSLRISVYSWVSHTVNTQRVLFPESLRNKEECKKTIVTRRIQTVELLQQEIAEKNPECRV